MNAGLIESGTMRTERHETDEVRTRITGGLPDSSHKPMHESRIRHAFIYGGPVMAYAALIFYLSSLSRFPEPVPSFFGFDMTAHFLEYFCFGCLIYRWFSSTNRYGQRRYALPMTILIGAFYALSDEWHQSFVPGRDASLWDVLFDTAGIVTAAADYPKILQGIFSRKNVNRGSA